MSSFLTISSTAAKLSRLPATSSVLVRVSGMNVTASARPLLPEAVSACSFARKNWLSVVARRVASACFNTNMRMSPRIEKSSVPSRRVTSSSMTPKFSLLAETITVFVRTSVTMATFSRACSVWFPPADSMPGL